MTLVLIGKDFLLEAKERKNGFQVYTSYFQCPFSETWETTTWKTAKKIGFEKQPEILEDFGGGNAPPFRQRSRLDLHQKVDLA